ncbi:zinc finger BED domain-containing protein RICESLEEPER 2-like [Arachis duranensis]|uniref:Zinc finger BED domain-containing protein RICESLEEPER 2-like n=1 Tax=Arachis duranensis TaxID=130453 RepID=A0A9C6THG9_ARADU|nr:zinc finger BED domain-containing protein RICESLEEPER 2-like [Arachis duranensis]
MDSTNMDVVAQEQQEETPVEETANFVPDESTSDENSNKSLLKNVYWQYFSRYKEGEERKAKCNHCKSVLGANPKNGTTNLKKHVLHYCKRIKLANSRQSTIAESLQRHRKNSSDTFIFDTSHTRKLIAKSICMHEYPLSYVDHVATREVFASMQPTFKMSSRNTIKKDIFEMYEVEKFNINKMMDANDSRVAITTDMWTSNQEKGYMVVTAHYIDSSWNLQMRVLSFTYVPAPHSSEVLSNALMKVLLEWNLDRKLSTITLDNCSTNDAMIDVLLGRLDSNYLLLGETAWLYRDVFARLKQKDSNYKSVPSNEEWELAKEICGKLKLFYYVTQLFSGTQVPTANIYFNKVCEIHVGLEKWAVSPNPVISSMACMMKRKFDKYWEEIHGIMGVAAILDPRYKLYGLEYKFARICEDPNECTRKVERIKQACYELLHEYQKNTSNSSNIQKKKEKGSFVKTEFDHYVEEDVHPLTPDFDILDWWKINGVRFPTLQKIARDIFAIPVSTVASESSFSTSGCIIANSLHEDTVCLQKFRYIIRWIAVDDYKREEVELFWWHHVLRSCLNRDADGQIGDNRPFGQLAIAMAGTPVGGELDVVKYVLRDDDDDV